MSAPTRHTLPARLDLTTAGPLAQSLRPHLGGDLIIDAAALTHLGTPGLQVLFAARRSWAEEGHALTVEGVSASVQEQLSQFGLTLADLGTSNLGTSDLGASDLAAEVGQIPDDADAAAGSDDSTTIDEG